MFIMNPKIPLLGIIKLKHKNRKQNRKFAF